MMLSLAGTRKEAHGSNGLQLDGMALALKLFPRAFSALPLQKDLRVACTATTTIFEGRPAAAFSLY
jgi:hypothetical protein